MANKLLPDELWKRLEPLLPKPMENRHVQFAGANPETFARSFLASCLSCGRVSLGVPFLPRAIFRQATPACAIVDDGRKRVFGNSSSRSCSPNFRRPTRSIGIAHWWIVPRYERPAEVRKPAQIPRIGAS